MDVLLNKNIAGKKVLVRVDFNVPLSECFEIIDDNRIVSALPTIKKLISLKAKVILMSHLGRPEKGEVKFSLSHVVNHLSKLLSQRVFFSQNCVGKEAVDKVSLLNNGEVLVLENLRYHKEEKMGDKIFAKKLASLADIYVNDAFGSAHREHASTAIISSYFPNNKYLGILFKKELKSLRKVVASSEKPFTAIIGGAKISSKIDVITSLIEKVDNLIIGGGMSYTFAKAQGGEVGMSILEKNKIEVAKSIIQKCKDKKVNLLLPIDSVNSNKFSNESVISESSILKINRDQIGMDIGPKSIRLFTEAIKKSKTIVWNGPMGVFESENFQNGTQSLGKHIAACSQGEFVSIIGGGDTAAALRKFNLDNKMTHLSTGGGASIELLSGKNLPAIFALEV